MKRLYIIRTEPVKDTIVCQNLYKVRLSVTLTRQYFYVIKVISKALMMQINKGQRYLAVL